MVWQHSGQASAASWAQRMQVEGRHGGGGQEGKLKPFRICHAMQMQSRQDLLLGLLLHGVPLLVSCCQLLLQVCGGSLSFLLEPAHARNTETGSVVKKLLTLGAQVGLDMLQPCRARQYVVVCVWSHAVQCACMQDLQPTKQAMWSTNC